MQNRVHVRHIEYCLPTLAVSNAELKAQNPDWRTDEIAEKTGVHSRRFSGPDELPSDLAYQAAINLFDREAIPRDSVDAIIFCTQSPDYIMPPNATLLHARLGLPKAVAAFDFTLACSGYVYGLAMAQAFIQSLGYRRILLVTADSYSRYIHPRDRSARTLFGDGAAVSLVEEAPDAHSGFIDIDLYTDGTGGPSFMVQAGGLRVPRSASTCIVKRDITGNERCAENIVMDGRAVLEFAKRDIPECVNRILADNELRLADLDLILFHQASLAALEVLNKALKIPPAKTFSNIREVGNTVSASLPILLKDAEAAGRLRRGDLVLLVGFGVGLSWGACLARW